MKKPLAATQIAKMVPLLIRGIAPTAAVMSGLLAPQALSAPGDLDPTFADVGRLGPVIDFGGTAWSAQLLDNDRALIAGGRLVCDYYCYYYHDFDATSFLTEITGTGSTDLSFTAAALAHTQVLDVALQADGSVIGVGEVVGRNSDRLTVFRLTADGTLDPTFADAGIFTLPSTAGSKHKGSSVVLDADGRIVVAGPRAVPASLVVLRLLPTGVLDETFGTAGVFIGPASDYVGSELHILRTSAGGYRVNTSACQIVALTADGALDNAFGTAGIVTIGTPSGPALTCNSMVAQPDERLLVAGNSAGTTGFAERLLAGGAHDPSFAANAVAATMQDATALAVSEDGSVVVAGLGGNGVSGAMVMRLQANGMIDTLFGNAGWTMLDLPSEFGTSTIVRSMKVRSDGAIVAAGGEYASRHPFVVRLVGTAGGASPGVIGVSQQDVVSASEQSHEAIVKVRRTGGSAGAVSVAYESATYPGGNPGAATIGDDFTHVSGRLTWNDGDMSDKEVHVPIADNESPENPEYFAVTLSDAQGVVGLGTRNATVEIAADGAPYGQFSIDALTANVAEPGIAQFLVSRNYASQGAVSVTVTPTSGTATAGSDFDSTAVVVSWADGESGAKEVDIPITDDAVAEQAESFTMQLSNPTGGALIGLGSSVAISIDASDQQVSQPPSGGGGSLGYLSLLMLSLARLLKMERRGESKDLSA